MGLVAVSTGALPRLLERPYWEAEAALEVALSLGGPPLELVLLPEWDPSGPPVTPYYCDWEESRGRDPEAVAGLVRKSGLKVASVHASRDIGMLLSMGEAEAERAFRQLGEALQIAGQLNASHVVLHAWDTFAPAVDPGEVARRLAALLSGGGCGREPGKAGEVAWEAPVPLAIEGVPVGVAGWTPCRLARAVAVGTSTLAGARRTAGPGAVGADTSTGQENAVRSSPVAGTVIDLNWSSMAGDFGEWVTPARGAFQPPMLNIHVQGIASPETGTVAPRYGDLDYAAALDRLRALYPDAQITLELNRPFSMEGARAALAWLRRWQAR